MLIALAVARHSRAGGPAGHRSSMPAYLHTAADLRHQDELLPDPRSWPVWRPTPRDVSDCAGALGWLIKSDAVDRSVVEYRSRAIDGAWAPEWSFIARRLGISLPRTYRAYRRAMAAAWVVSRRRKVLDTAAGGR